MLLNCPTSQVEATLRYLREAGQRKTECVVLWLGKRTENAINIVESYRPLQFARADQFRIPPEGMTALQSKLRALRLMVASQVHSHPGPAFHSEADDAWAIVRHEGALSLVVPQFAAYTTLSNFKQQAKLYRYSSRSTWDEVEANRWDTECLKLS